MTHPTDPPELAEALATMDETLARILTEPSWAHQLLTATAVGLAIEEPFLVATTADIDAAITSVAECLIYHLPDVVVEDVLERAAAVVPKPRPRETHSQYALRLRAAAEAL
ncbi:hypothetical protein ACIGNW_00180 [Streptomyces sp. NPDC053707]|uniref:hypothetical protein n=1 Tax=Streptomyces sp. NPDC053707 TaxID=3365712 RepID=UPI0037CEA06C